MKHRLGILTVLMAVALGLVFLVPVMTPAQGPGWGGGYGYGMGPGMMGYGYGYGRGPGMMGYGPGPQGVCPGFGGPAAQQTPITDDQAKAAAQEYADKYLKGFKVDKVLPFSVPMGTAYSVELKGPGDEMRILHVNPWGNVGPSGGPWRRSG